MVKLNEVIQGDGMNLGVNHSAIAVIVLVFVSILVGINKTALPSLGIF